MNQSTVQVPETIRQEYGGESQSTSRDPRACPICGSASATVFIKREYPIRDCQSCGHRFAEVDRIKEHVERVYADSYFKGAVGGYPDYLADERRLVSHGRRYARILNRYTEPGTVLDVGAAAGFILKGFEQSGWTGKGIEPNSAMASYAWSSANLDIEVSPLEESQLEEQFDVVAMIQVIAHFAELRRAFEVANELTKPGGYWLIETWNRDSWTARIFGEKWHEFNPPSVLHWFSIESLMGLIEDFGFQQIALGRPRKRISLSHAKSIADEGILEGIPGELIRRGLSLFPRNFTLPYLFDDIFWIIVRKPKTQ